MFDDPYRQHVSLNLFRRDDPTGGNVFYTVLRPLLNEILARPSDLQQIVSQRIRITGIIAQTDEPVCLRTTDRMVGIEQVLRNLFGRNNGPVSVAEWHGRHRARQSPERS